MPCNAIDYDIAVVGAGHAGCEAAHIAAKLGAKTLLIGMNLDAIAWMPCNPAIGGTAKSHLVREIDALGGLMGLAADATYLQIKTLNASRGAAVQSLRMQSDKHDYSRWMRHYLSNTENLFMYQAMVTDILLDSQNNITGVRTSFNETIRCQAVIVTSGTFMEGRIFIGKQYHAAGRSTEPPSVGLSESLRQIGLELGRLKTGTPARLDSRSVDYSQLERHDGDRTPSYFSFMPDRPHREQLPCYSTHTNSVTHEIIHDCIGESPLYSGLIEGVGPRYCPSIEDKVIRFADKKSHLLFLEPESRHTNEIYLQGCSTSLPIWVQRKILTSLPGLANVHIARPAYAVEYDFMKPHQFCATLAAKNICGFFGAGQVLGTSGYEEAAAQGLVAGINAYNYIYNHNKFILDRSQSYIGTLIDDLISKDIKEPYRMMTSRSEYRLSLRQDNADQRLSPFGRELGTVDDSRWNIFTQKINHMNAEINLLKKTKNSDKVPLYNLLERPEINYTDIDAILQREPSKTAYVPRFEIETQIKYAGYIVRQNLQNSRFHSYLAKQIPDNIDYTLIEHLSNEAREKLQKIKPGTIAEALRIDGVRNADINILLLYLKQPKG